MAATDLVLMSCAGPVDVEVGRGASAASRFCDRRAQSTSAHQHAARLDTNIPLHAHYSQHATIGPPTRMHWRSCEEPGWGASRLSQTIPGHPQSPSPPLHTPFAPLPSA